MSVIEQQLVDSIEAMDMEQVLNDFELDQLPRRDEMQLQSNGDCSLRMCLPADFWQANGHTLDDPGGVEIVYWKELGIAMIDLGGPCDE